MGESVAPSQGPGWNSIQLCPTLGSAMLSQTPIPCGLEVVTCSRPCVSIDAFPGPASLVYPYITWSHGHGKGCTVGRKGDHWAFLGAGSRRATAGGPFTPGSVLEGSGSLENRVGQDPWGSVTGWLPINPPCLCKTQLSAWALDVWGYLPRSQSKYRVRRCYQRRWNPPTSSPSFKPSHGLQNVDPGHHLKPHTSHRWAFR